MTALLAIAAGLGGCNLVVGEQVAQCASDEDCKRFDNGSVCRDGVCAIDGGAGGGGGCFTGEPAEDAEFLDACTDADCVPFDNCARLSLCAGGSLPALVDPPAP